MVKLDKKGKIRTDAYVGTFDTGCAGDMLEVESIRTLVKGLNQELKNSGAVCKYGRDLRFRVDVKGRKPIHKPRKTPAGNYTGWTWGGDVIGGLSNAGAVDVYIHRRYTW